MVLMPVEQSAMASAPEATIEVRAISGGTSVPVGMVDHSQSDVK